LGIKKTKVAQQATLHTVHNSLLLSATPNRQQIIFSKKEFLKIV
jgi:hypothetical protein